MLNPSKWSTTAWRISGFLTAIALVILAALAALNLGSLNQAATIEDFEFLEKGMSYQSVVDRVGEPDEDIGHGVYVFVYEIADNHQVLISFIDLDSLYAAYVVDQDGAIICDIVAR